MRPRGDLRHHAAIGRVLALLAQHRLRQHAPVLVQHRRRRLVAGGLDAQHRAHAANPIFPVARESNRTRAMTAAMPPSPLVKPHTHALPLRVGTRGSPLALIQTRGFLAVLTRFCPVLRSLDVFEEHAIRTTGDAVQDRRLAEIGGKGLFAKEIHEALADRRIDFAVHSLKDLETDAAARHRARLHAAARGRPRRADPGRGRCARSIPPTRSPACRPARSSAPPRSAARRSCCTPARTSPSPRCAATCRPGSTSWPPAPAPPRCSPMPA